MRYAYEWEVKKEPEVVLRKWQAEAERLRAEVKRISNETLRANFAKPEDREYWVKRLKELTSRLSAYEDMIKNF